MRVAVVGINGVGKEHVRTLMNQGVDLMLVDLPKVIEALPDDATLTNTFPGHEFTLQLPPGTMFWTGPEDLSETLEVLVAAEVTHVIHATPPGQRQLFEFLHLMGGFQQFVEKPYLSDISDPGVGVGYVYHGHYSTTFGATITAPNQGGWREGMAQVPLIWDLLGHVVATLPAGQQEMLHLVSRMKDPSPNELEFGVGGTWPSVRAYYSEQSQAWNERQRFDWTESFDTLIASWLRGTPRCRAVDAIRIEQQLARLEQEVLDVWSIRDDDPSTD